MDNEKINNSKNARSVFEDHKRIIENKLFTNSYNLDRISQTLNMKRNEKILVLPYNTLRIFDTMVQIEIEKSKNPEWFQTIQEVTFRMVTRTIKDLGKFNNVDSNIVKEEMENDWARYYELAPRTQLYSLLNFLRCQSFTTDIVVLFHKKDAIDPDMKCDYYDGTIEGLESYITDNGITCIIMDDIELLKTLIDRGNVDMNWKTIIISKLGYNYYKDKTSGLLLMKHIDELSSKACMEIGSYTLMGFNEDFLKRINVRK